MRERKLVLPWPLSLNQYLFGVPQGKFATIAITPKGKKYKARIVSILFNQSIPPLKGRLKVELWIWSPTALRFDLDNMYKALFDGMTEARIWEDDKQVYEKHAYKMGKDPRGLGYKGGLVLMIITELPETAEKDFTDHLIDRWGIPSLEGKGLLPENEQENF